MNKISTTIRILFAAFQSIIIIIGIWYAVFLYYTDILSNRQVEQTFEKTQCHILQAKLSTKKWLVRWYRADFKVSYSVQGPEYLSDVLGYGVDHSFTTDQAPQQFLLRTFLVGKSYPCWYNSLAPHVVVLAPKHRFSSSFILFFDLIFVTFAFYGLIRNIFSGVSVSRFVN